MKPYYSASLPEFVREPVPSLIGKLTTSDARSGFHQQSHRQTQAWEAQARILKESVNELRRLVELDQWGIVMEYPIPRRGGRVDVILLARDVVLAIEFKIGASAYHAADIAQVEDYALDLRDFHVETRGRKIVPILVASEADSCRVEVAFREGDTVSSVALTNPRRLAGLLVQLVRSLSDGENHIDLAEWIRSDYRPTPTIIEAATTLYAGQHIREITRSHAGVDNLTETTNAVLAAVEDARRNNRKTICFITGVPGSGKTLAGLNIVHSRDLHDGDLGVFLSGNGPLVKVLTEALARDHAQRKGVRIGESRRRVKTFVQNVHRFLDAYHGTSKCPPDKVVIFDEAQRAWNRQQSKRKFDRDFSEPEMMLEIMDRHDDWAFVTALVGGGQEINTGEAGLSEWGRALADNYSHWRVLVSPFLLTGHHSTGGSVLFEEVPPAVNIKTEESLHLKVSIRAFRADRLSAFVEALLAPNSKAARQILDRDLGDYPLLMTRDIGRAKEWLRARKQGMRRIGMTASSGARRLRRFGYDVRSKLDVANWFLNGPTDVRSSFYLEDVATEFDIQGLELDWTCVCWGGDFRMGKAGWLYRRFSGTTWQAVRSLERREYIRNKYRVLLTRAREGVVIFVPPGDEDDQTATPEIYDGVADHLLACGLREL